MVVLFYEFCFALSYLLFGVACFFSILYIYQDKNIKAKKPLLLKKSFPSLGRLLAISSQCIFWGFILLTIGITVGVSPMFPVIEKVDIMSPYFIFILSLWGIYGLILLFITGRALAGSWMAKGAIASFSIISLICFFGIPYFCA